MPSPATSDAAKHAANAFPAPPTLSQLFSALWLGVQDTAQNLLTPKAIAPLPPVTVPGSSSADPMGLSPLPGRAEAMPDFVAAYGRTLEKAWREHDWSDVAFLVETLHRCWSENRQLFLCGNGGSAANAIHLANDFLYGVDKRSGRGLRVIALPANAAVLTCLANDIAYEDIYAQQLTVLAQPGDILLAFSGSGNSPNIVKALTRATELGVSSFAVLGFTGGRALELATHPIYFPVHDMQVAEDLQMMVGHMAMQALSRQGRA